MSDYNEQTLTEAVIKRVAATSDPRLRQIMISLVKHLHGFVREVRPTWEELLAGIQFLTAVGQKCDDKRQQFILLSDTLGVSMMVDLISYGKFGNATESDLLGPAWVEGAPELPLGSNLAKHRSDGEPCVITGSVASLDGTPLAGAVVDFWEADGDGFYDLQEPNGPNLRARLRTDALLYAVSTILANVKQRSKSVLMKSRRACSVSFRRLKLCSGRSATFSIVGDHDSAKRHGWCSLTRRGGGA